MPLLNSAEQDAARTMYLSNKNLSIEDVANSFGVSRITMLRYLRGITRPRGGRVTTNVSTATMRKMRDEEGLTFREIGERVGLSVTGVQYRLRTETGRKSA